MTDGLSQGIGVEFVPMEAFVSSMLEDRQVLPPFPLLAPCVWPFAAPLRLWQGKLSFLKPELSWCPEDPCSTSALLSGHVCHCSSKDFISSNSVQNL
jgi:hypothetical protein